MIAIILSPFILIGAIALSGLDEPKPEPKTEVELAFEAIDEPIPDYTLDGPSDE